VKTIKQLKEELGMNVDLTDLMDVLKGIAATEFWILQKKKKRFEDFTKAFEGFFRFIDFIDIQHPFVREQGKLAIIMITSDEGFMGGLNTRVISAALSYPGADGAQLMIVGEQGASYLSAQGRRFVGFPGFESNECYEASLKVKDYIMKEGLKGNFGRLVLFYPRPVSFMVQKIEQLELLPCNRLFEKESEKIKDWKNVIVESPVDHVIEYLVETWIVQKLFEVFEDSKLAELSARTLHLEESYQTLVQQKKGLRHQYFQSRHELVDSEMRDMFSAQIVRKKAKVKKSRSKR
jgi:ATP synthase F1 gamma subunit